MIEYATLIDEIATEKNPKKPRIQNINKHHPGPNGEVREEVPRHKYLGEIINNKGNLSDHLEEIEKKIKGATATMLAETGNKEFKKYKNACSMANGGHYNHPNITVLIW